MGVPLPEAEEPTLPTVGDEDTSDGSSRTATEVNPFAAATIRLNSDDPAPLLSDERLRNPIMSCCRL